MTLVDVNLLLAATIEEAPDHERASRWLTAQVAARAPIGLPWASLLGFVRVAAQRGAWRVPLIPSQTLPVVERWLGLPSVWVPEPGPRHAAVLGRLLAPERSPKLVPDAHLAALAIEHDLELCSRDRDFGRWHQLGLRSRDPLLS